MTRAAAAVCVLCIASVAMADPPAKKQEKKADDKAEAADLEVKPKPVQPTIDLFPKTVLKKREKTERKRRITLGDDKNWKVQAAQVGAMVGLFAGLAALCGGGKCLMPKEVTDALPGWMRAEPPVYSNPRREQKVRKAR